MKRLIKTVISVIIVIGVMSSIAIVASAGTSTATLGSNPSSVATAKTTISATSATASTTLSRGDNHSNVTVEATYKWVDASTDTVVTSIKNAGGEQMLQ